MIYPILLIFGFIGLVVMAFVGSLKTGAHHGRAQLGHKRILSGISIIDVLAMCMGAGAMGIVGRKFMKQPQFVVIMMAIAGAIVIDFLVVKPLFSMIMRFASTPSEGLEGMISQLAEAATTFDSQGRGLIKLSLDGQTSQVLANLEQSELAAGIQVHKGDRLVVLEVDPKRNICRVSRDIASEP